MTPAISTVSSASPSLAATAPAALTPVAAKERIQTLDILRGFALFGILWMNIPMNYDGTTAFQHIVGQLGQLLADGKFYTTYSFLFGLGFSVQLLRAQARGVPIVPVYLRRLFVLLLIGLAHCIFLWWGDILQAYALMGVYLLLLRKRSLRTLLVLAALCLVFEIFFDAATGRLGQLRRADPEVARTQELQRPANELNRQVVVWERAGRAEDRGTYPELVSARATLLRERFSHRWHYFSGIIVCMFLLGLYAGRRAIFHNTAAHLPFLRKLMWWALGVGFTLNLADVVAGELGGHYHLFWPKLVGDAVYTLGRPALCLFYVCGLTLLLQNERWRERLRPLSWAGRMGLTNYLLQSVVFTTIFYTYGLGLMPKASPMTALGLALAIYPLQILLSMWWMRRFQYGPMEWLWRSLTYMKLQPMRVVRP